MISIVFCVLMSVIILAWASRCVFSKSVNDGIIGKFFYIGLAMSATATILTCDQQYLKAANPLFFTGGFLFALLVRHWWMRDVWPRIHRNNTKSKCQ